MTILEKIQNLTWFNLVNSLKNILTDLSGSSAGTPATPTTQGLVKLAGDLAGTADLPTVPGLASKQATLVSATNIKTVNGNSILGAGNLAITTPIVDATPTVKGSIQLAGDLAGTSAAPTVPGLAGKQATLVSATNIKTVNGVSILGAGNLPVVSPDATAAANGLIRLAGDLAGTALAPTVPGLAGKQATLVSGTNIKTINSTTILGTGNIVVATANDIINPVLEVYADNAAAIAGSLPVGRMYKTATGEIRIVI